ncbi:MAG: leucyl aminopeptidase, partial [Nocardioides sp.]
MTSYQLRSASPAKTRSDVVVVGARPTSKGVVLADGAGDVADAFGRKLRPLLSTLGFNGKAGEVAKVPTSGTIASPLLVVVGLGDGTDQVAVRRAAGLAARAVANAASVALALPADSTELVRAVVEGYSLGGYAFTTYRTKQGEHDAPKPAGTVTVLSPIARKGEAETALAEALVVAEAVAGTRDWVNTPAGDLTPPLFADAVVAAAKKVGARKVKAKVYDEQELVELGCGGLLGVGGGSAAPPRLVELTWSPPGATRHVALVGKGITFDSGGLTIKPASGMTTMKCDMAGAASVVQAVLAAARLELPVKVTAYAAMAENMVSGSSMRPGDVLTIHGGQTVEVTNTDAEGRLVLADALVKASETEPDVLLDVATLTGAMVLALGDRVGGVLGGDDVVESVVAAGATAGEAHWPMPIPESMDERVHA